MLIKVDHVAVIVQDMDLSIEFYSKLFGFRVRARAETKAREVCFLVHSNQPGYEIELIRDLVPQTYSSKGIVNHLAFTIENMEEAIAYFRQEGVAFHTEAPNVAVDGRKTIFFSGPNEELLQLVEPSGRTSDEQLN